MGNPPDFTISTNIIAKITLLVNIKLANFDLILDISLAIFRLAYIGSAG
jgi:hypothetical protein